MFYLKTWISHFSWKIGRSGNTRPEFSKSGDPLIGHVTWGSPLPPSLPGVTHPPWAVGCGSVVPPSPPAPPPSGIYICDLPMPGCAQRRWDTWGRGYWSPCPPGPPRRLRDTGVPGSLHPASKLCQVVQKPYHTPHKAQATYFLKIICLGDPLSWLGILFTKCGLNPITSPPPTKEKPCYYPASLL